MYLDDKGECHRHRGFHPLRRGRARHRGGHGACVEENGAPYRSTKVIAPSIALARKGFPRPAKRYWIPQQKRRTWARWPATTEIFWKVSPLKRGDLLVQKTTAQSMRLIAQQVPRPGPRRRHRQKIAAEMAPHAGAVTLQDLREYKVAERADRAAAPTVAMMVVTMPPPSSAARTWCKS